MSETNTDTAITPAPAAKPVLSLGQRLAATDPAVLEAQVISHRDALVALIDDTTLTDATRAAVRNIAALASPSRPGLEEMGGTWSIPRAAIAQPTSNSDNKPESAKNGDIYTTSGQLLERPAAVIPLYLYEENIMFPAAAAGSKVPLCQSIDAKLGSPFGECVKCPNLPFGKQNGGRGEQQQTECYSNIVIYALTADLQQVIKFQFGKTSRKAGSALHALVRQQQMVWKQSYLLNTEKKTGNLGVYWIYNVAPTGKNNGDDVAKMCAAINGLLNAERQVQLANWYSRPARAPMIAAEAEAEFGGGALAEGLGASIDVTPIEPDLSTPVTPPPPPSGKSARNSSKPM